MKALVSLVVVAALIGAVYMLSSGGCRAQTQVAGDKILEKINSWLGELDVKRREISNEIDKLDKAVENVRKQKIQAEVQLEEYRKKIEPIKSEVSRIKDALALLQPHVQATEAVEINGASWAPEKVRENINLLLDEYETLNQKLGGLEVSVNAFQQSYDLLATQQASADKTMKMLKDKLADIDIKKEALDSMKTAQTILGEGGSISDEFSKLEKDINDLFVDVEAGMRLETEKIAERERDLASSTSTVDNVLKELESADETAARLEAILGKGPTETPDQ